MLLMSVERKPHGGGYLGRVITLQACPCGRGVAVPRGWGLARISLLVPGAGGPRGVGATAGGVKYDTFQN